MHNYIYDEHLVEDSVLNSHLYTGDAAGQRKRAVARDPDFILQLIDVRILPRRRDSVLLLQRPEIKCQDELVLAVNVLRRKPVNCRRSYYSYYNTYITNAAWQRVAISTFQNVLYTVLQVRRSAPLQ